MPPMPSLKPRDVYEVARGRKQEVDPQPGETLGVGGGVPWQSHTDWLARKQAERAGGYGKPPIDKNT